MASNSSCVPSSMSCPSSKTRILSQRRATPADGNNKSGTRFVSGEEFPGSFQLRRPDRWRSGFIKHDELALSEKVTRYGSRSHSPPDTSRPPNSCPSQVSSSCAKVEPALSSVCRRWLSSCMRFRSPKPTLSSDR